MKVTTNFERPASLKDVTTVIVLASLFLTDTKGACAHRESDCAVCPHQVPNPGDICSRIIIKDLPSPASPHPEAL